MVSKVVFSAVATLLFVQVAFGQQFGCGCGANILNQPSIISNNLGLLNSGAGISNLGYSNGLIGNSLIGNGLIGNSLIGNGLIGNGLIGTGVEVITSGPSYNNAGIFSVNSGSPAYNYPGGVLVNSENQINGQVSVTGAMPFSGAAYYGGDVPSTGEALLSYGAGPSVSLNGGGCGYGLAGASAGLASSVLGGFGGSVFGNGLGGASIINNGFPIIGASGCGCGF